MTPYYIKYDEDKSYTLTVYGESEGVFFCGATYFPIKNYLNVQIKYIQFFPSSEKIFEDMEYVKEIDADAYKEYTLPGLLDNWTSFGKPVIKEGVESLFANTPDFYYTREFDMDMCRQMYILPSHLICN